ncbi:hypothetical protein H920_12292 [Fukomys damarensis]|uniref:Uncharacterized protein n=1 Tax=Fukomys damarensis TaxID=885580 RepID=A0A091D762_FUKDA|nr:hypothetical protein H920_12292 [Fukomys damarensis]
MRGTCVSCFLKLIWRNSAQKTLQNSCLLKRVTLGERQVAEALLPTVSEELTAAHTLRAQSHLSCVELSDNTPALTETFTTVREMLPVELNSSNSDVKQYKGK